MLVSKIQTYLSVKMHIKSYYKKPAIFGLSNNLACFFCNNFKNIQNNLLNWDLHQK
jgi:hypothetical protein